MKKIFILLFSIALLSSCCDTSNCKFQKGDDVHIKNKWRHDDATVVSVHCGCEYTISYFSYLGTARHRHVTEYEIEEKGFSLF